MTHIFHRYTPPGAQWACYRVLLCTYTHPVCTCHEPLTQRKIKQRRHATRRSERASGSVALFCWLAAGGAARTRPNWVTGLQIVQMPERCLFIPSQHAPLAVSLSSPNFSSRLFRPRGFAWVWHCELAANLRTSLRDADGVCSFSWARPHILRLPYFLLLWLFSRRMRVDLITNMVLDLELWRALMRCQKLRPPQRAH
jgi:hypothetical protein